MTKFILISPGSTEFDRQGRILGTLDVPLSEEGTGEIDQIIRQLGDESSLNVVYTSPCESAEQTAGRMAEALGIRAKKLDQLKNIDHGLWQGMLVEDVKRKQPKVFKQWQEKPDTVCPPEGEMLSEARGRVESCIVKICKKNKSGTVGIVAPEPLASLIRSILSRSELQESWQTQGAGGNWEVIDFQPVAATRA